MNPLSRLFGSRVMAEVSAPTPRDPSNDFWFGEAVRRTAANIQVTIERARQVPVVRDCLGTLSATIGALAWQVFERRPDDSREPAPLHPVARLLREPNPYATSVEFLTQMVDDLAAEGGFLCDLSDGRYLWRVLPGEYVLEQLPDRSRRVRVREPGKAERILVEGEFWYIPVPPLVGGFAGRSPIRVDGRETIAAAIALHEYANSFWANDATPRLVLKHKGSFADEASKRNFLASWSKWITGANRHKPAVAEHGIEPTVLAHTNEQSQFLETRKEIALDCARLYRMPPHKVGLLDKATFSNIEHQSIEYVTDTLSPWLELIEASINKWLVADPRFYFEFNVESQLRGDTTARYAAYAVGRQWGWLSVNEIRRRENLNGIGMAGDRFIEPLNMVPAGSPARPEDKQRAQEKAIAFLRESVAANGGRPHLKVIEHAA